MGAPGVGPIISSAMVAAMETGDALHKGRDYGLVWHGSKSRPASEPFSGAYRGAVIDTCERCSFKVPELHRISEEKSERLDMVLAQFRVVVTRRPKYACRACEDGVMQAEAPARLIEGGLPTEPTVAQVLVSKYADHLPF